MDFMVTTSYSENLIYENLPVTYVAKLHVRSKVVYQKPFDIYSSYVHTFYMKMMMTMGCIVDMYVVSYVATAACVVITSTGVRIPEIP